MKLKIISVKNQGVASKEYVMLKALEDCNLSSYMILDNTYDASGELSNKSRHVYIFPECSVKEGQFVCLNTGKGKYKLGKTDKGNPLHYFYWGLEHSVWNDDGDVAHLIRIGGHQKLRISPQ